ncbi:MAG: hypothetical protein MRZ98_09400 [Clostridiales bacterium]|nr:hypothetical protein [Clostridiales bacterium]
MRNFFKALTKRRELLKQAGQIQYDSQGRAILTMRVRDDGDFLSPYSLSREETISADVAEFLTESAMAVHPRTPMTLHIHSQCIDEKEQDVYRWAIRSYFTLQAIEHQRTMRRNAIQSAVMEAVGVVSLAGMVWAEKMGVSGIWIECMDIFAWVFVWEAVDLFFIERGMLRLKQKRLDAFMDMTVRYFDTD